MAWNKRGKNETTYSGDDKNIPEYNVSSEANATTYDKQSKNTTEHNKYDRNSAEFTDNTANQAEYSERDKNAVDFSLGFSYLITEDENFILTEKYEKILVSTASSAESQIATYNELPKSTSIWTER